MTIIKIEEVSPKKRKIFLDDRTSFVLYKAEVRRLQLEEGQAISEEIYAEITDKILLKRAKARCMYLLAKSDYTEFQLRNKMKQAGYPEVVQDCTVEYLMGLHYLDDERYARSFISYRKDKKSRRLLLQELQQKGVSGSVAGMIYDELCDGDEERAIRKIVEKKRVDLDNISREEAHKLYMHLARKGFPTEKIRYILRTGIHEE